MEYILVYDQTADDYDGCGTHIESNFEIFNSYEELINFMADLDYRYPRDYNWLHIFKSEDCKLDLYMEDVNAEKNKIMIEHARKLQKKKELESKLAEERRIREEKELEDRERALLRELIKKYGDLV